MELPVHPTHASWLNQIDVELHRGARCDQRRARLLHAELDALRAEGIEAYERLLLDVMHGDHLLFTRADEVELLWERAAPLLDAPPDALPYERGSWGLEAADKLAAPHGWRLGERGRWAADGRPDPVQPLRTGAESTSG